MVNRMVEIIIAGIAGRKKIAGLTWQEYCDIAGLTFDLLMMISQTDITGLTSGLRKTVHYIQCGCVGMVVRVCDGKKGYLKNLGIRAIGINRDCMICLRGKMRDGYE